MLFFTRMLQLLRLLYTYTTVFSFGVHVKVDTAAQPNMVKLSVPSGTEGSQLTLTCQSPEDTRGMIWMSRSNSTALLNSVGTIHNSFDKKTPCVPPSPETYNNFEPNPTLYTYSCPSSSRQTLTIRNVTSSNHGEIWQCGAYSSDEQRIIYMYSNNVTISVQDNAVVPGETSSCDQGQKQIQTHNIGVLVGSVIGACAIGIALGIVGTWLLLHRRNSKTSESAHHYEIANGPRNEGEYATIGNNPGNNQANTEYHRYDDVASGNETQNSERHQHQSIRPIRSDKN